MAVAGSAGVGVEPGLSLLAAVNAGCSSDSVGGIVLAGNGVLNEVLGLFGGYVLVSTQDFQGFHTFGTLRGRWCGLSKR